MFMGAYHACILHDAQGWHLQESVMTLNICRISEVIDCSLLFDFYYFTPTVRKHSKNSRKGTLLSKVL